MFEDWAEALPEGIRGKGVPLDSPGPFESAWPVACAGQLFNWLGENKHAVTGGEVYLRNGKDFIGTTEGWGCEIERGESWESYCMRSVQVARDYLAKRVNRNDIWLTIEASDRPNVQQLLKSYAR